jgi:D-alanine-D-alanine ligase-like ATP-grasp enzyme
MPSIVKIPFAVQMIREVAPEIGATVWIEPEYGFVGEITFENGSRHLFRNTNFNVNPLGSVEIVKDKWYTSMFLERYGYRVARWRTFFSDAHNSRISVNRDIHDGWAYIEELWLPVMIKPNNLSQGVWVHRVDSKEDYYSAAASIFEKSSVMIIEKFHIWQDYRVVVFDNEIISAYTRVPLFIIGNGSDTISDLLRIKQDEFIQSGRDTVIDIHDSRISLKLQKQWLTYESIPSLDEQIFLLDNANLSSWWESIDVTSTIHPDFAALAIQVTKDMWLRLCGVDIMTSSIETPLMDNPDYIILELNGAPGLDNYMSTGSKQRDNVKSMYKKILIALSDSE